MEFKPGEQLPIADMQAVTAEYFRVMGIPLAQGRMLDENDTADRPRVLLISRELARREFPGVNPIGQQIRCGYDMDQSWWTIVGVVGDIRQESPGAPPAESMYVPVAQHAGRATDMQVVVRTQSNPAAMEATLERLLKHDFPLVAVSSMTMREAVGESTRADRFRMMLFCCFAGVSILLAAVGMYGVTAYTVAQRRFEFALRLALGAQRGQIVAQALNREMAIVLLGVGAGVALSLALMRVLGTLLGKLPAFDAVSYAIAAGGVLLIAVAAVLAPCRRAAQVEPMQVLRGE
jgi:putative ABC transport system permease protein